MRRIMNGTAAAWVLGLSMMFAVGMREPAMYQATEPFLGQMAWVGFNFAPNGWALCNGQIMSISQNTALFSLLGTTYGGNGTTTFGLPNLQGRVMVHQGQSSGTSIYDLGQMGGTETETLNTNQMPAHTHTGASHTHGIPALPVTVPASTANGTSLSPDGQMLAVSSMGAARGNPSNIYNGGPANATFAEGATTGTGTSAATTPGVGGITGGSQPHNNIQPYTTVNCIIATQGIFPSRGKGPGPVGVIEPMSGRGGR